MDLILNELEICAFNLSLGARQERKLKRTASFERNNYFDNK